MTPFEPRLPIGAQPVGAPARLVTLGGALALTIVTGCADPPSAPDRAEPPPEAPAAAPVHEVVVHPVVWPAAAALDDEARQALPPAAQAAVQRATVPVLVVGRPAALAASIVMTKPLWTALSTRFDGVTVSLSGTRAAHRYPHLAPAEGRARVRGKPAWVTQNEGIWSAAWREFGVAYVLEVECGERPDPRCADDGFVLELAHQLRYVGGAGEGGTP